MAFQPTDPTNARYRVLVFSKTSGFRHDAIPDAVAALHHLGAGNGFAVDSTEDASPFTDEGLARYRAVVFLLTTGDVLNTDQKAAFERYIRAGNGYVGVHSASDTEYAWPWYGGLVGAYFAEHPAIQEATLDVEDRGHRSTAHLPVRWTRTDEWYTFRTNPRVTPGLRVLAALDESTYRGGSMGDHPIAWYQPTYDGGRSWYTGGGHTAESYQDPAFLQHLLGGIELAAGAPSPPPPGALVLFDGSGTEAWQPAVDPGRPIDWPVVDGALEVRAGSGDIRTIRAFGDFRLHLEFRTSPSPPDASEQERGNSGVYLQGRYEVQILDSWSTPTWGGQNDAGALYALKDADLNASLPPETWQTYDITFRAARFAADGTKSDDARVTVLWNGVLVHDDIPLPAPTPGGAPESDTPGPLLLQDHAQPVRFRNVWIEEIPSLS